MRIVETYQSITLQLHQSVYFAYSKYPAQVQILGPFTIFVFILLLRLYFSGETEPCHYIRVLHEEESYGIRKNLPTEDFAHHMFHLHPPLLLQNLLPFTITTADMVSCTP